jgi:hypothetical protein
VCRSCQRVLKIRHMSGALFKEKIMSKKDELFTDIDPVSNKYGVDINIPDVVRANWSPTHRDRSTPKMRHGKYNNQILTDF